MKQLRAKIVHRRRRLWRLRLAHSTHKTPRCANAQHCSILTSLRIRLLGRLFYSAAPCGGGGGGGGAPPPPPGRPCRGLATALESSSACARKAYSRPRLLKPARHSRASRAYALTKGPCIIASIFFTFQPHGCCPASPTAADFTPSPGQKPDIKKMS